MEKAVDINRVVTWVITLGKATPTSGLSRVLADKSDDEADTLT